MGRIKELKDKQSKGEITEDEKKELQTLLAEAETDSKAKKADEDTQEDVDQEVEKLAQSVADSITSKTQPVMDKLDKVMKAFETGSSELKKTKEEKGFIVDKKLGKKSIEELSEIKLAIPERKASGKKVTEISMKTSHFISALLTKNVEKLQILSEGTPGDGGYLVPEEFANMIVEDIRDIAVMRTIAGPAMTINSDTLHLPSLTSRPKAAWRAEKATKNTSTAQFGENVFTPYSLAVIVSLSNELAADASLGVSGSIVNYISGLMAQSLTEKEENAFWVGDGSGKPSGVDGGVYSLRTVTASSTDSSRADAVVSAFQRTPQGYRNRGVFVANSGTLENISKLKDNNGNYLLTTLANSPTQVLRGRPVYEQNDLAGGTLLFGDFGYYQIVDREGISVRVSDEATVAGSSAFEKNLTHIRVEKRVDAELTLPAAVTKVTGLGTP